MTIATTTMPMEGNNPMLKSKNKVGTMVSTTRKKTPNAFISLCSRLDYGMNRISSISGNTAKRTAILLMPNLTVEQSNRIENGVERVSNIALRTGLMFLASRALVATMDGSMCNLLDEIQDLNPFGNEPNANVINPINQDPTDQPCPTDFEPYIVEPGDNMTTVLEENGYAPSPTQVSETEKLNHLSPDELNVGDQICIPKNIDTPEELLEYFALTEEARLAEEQSNKISPIDLIKVFGAVVGSSLFIKKMYQILNRANQNQ
jgi:hypothetical protein